ncbi:hypothetical protein [Acrocarpospora sp. B8E8]|uniref:hypothetical protein n=1 Tax=Acrocarpospora sp. B8E8 TaxID=3153572 RepID=UPI00325E0B87
MTDQHRPQTALHAEVKSLGQQLPVVVYLDSEDELSLVLDAINAIPQALEIELLQSRHSVRGVWRAFIGALRKQASPDRLEDTASAVRAGVQARVYGEIQSQVTKATSEAVANLLDQG